MRILVIGSSGFIGREVVKILSHAHDVYAASRDNSANGENLKIDLLEKDNIAAALAKVRPEAIINCAGVVENSPRARLNPEFTSNLLEVIANSDLGLERLIISGSAAVYGPVDKQNIPVDEVAPLHANSDYGLSKLQEETIALDYRGKYQLPIVVARLFNPIGIGMHARLLIPSLTRQIQEIELAKQDFIEVSRLDSRRDYIDISDVAEAFKAIIEADPRQAIYNVGSGKSTSNQELIDLMLKSSKLEARPRVVETSVMPEPVVAIAADIKRINKELHWKPKKTLEETIKEIMHAPHKR